MKFKLSKLFDNKRFLMIFSLVCAFLSWLVIVTYIDTNTPWTINGVPVDLTTGQEKYLSPNDLNVVSDEDVLVKVEVEGDRKIVGGLRADDLFIYADLSNIPQPGTYSDVPLLGTVPNLKGVTIKTITPSTIKLRVDRLTTANFDIKPEITGLTVPDDYLRYELVVNPKTVEITGPDSDIQRIDKCVASVAFTEPLTKTVTKTADIKLYNAEGTEMSTDTLIIGTRSVDITVPVYKKKNLKVEFTYTDYPTGFPLDKFDYILSSDNIEVAGPESVVDKLDDTINIGYIPLNEIHKGMAMYFEVSPPNNTEIVSDFKTITVEFDLDDVATATFNIPSSNIFIKNVPANYSADLITTTISNVQLLGDPEIMETLSAQDIIAEIDLSMRELSTGPFKMPVQISVPGKGFVWAVNNSEGAYTAIVNIQDKTAS